MTNPGTIDLQKFALGKGRKRPPYAPRNISCPNCNGTLEIADERAGMVVCAYCDHKLELTAVEAKVLEKGPAKKWEFPLKIGDKFRWKGGRHEVTARLVYLEDEDETEATRVYYLYSPRRGPLWLSEYRGKWDLSESTHVKPTSNPFLGGTGAGIGTFDGRKWKLIETGVLELVYVDGALPWIATVGDRSTYAEFSEKGGRGFLEAESSGTEIEISFVEPLPAERLAEALERTAGETARLTPAPVEDDAERSRRGRIVLALACVAALVLNGFLYFWAAGRGASRLTAEFGPAAVTAGVETEPFHVEKSGNVIKVVVDAPGLNDAWMAVDVDLLRHENGEEIYSFPATLEYFSGVEGGESWSEGSRDDATYVKITNDGLYRLRIQAVSGMGDSTEAAASIHGLHVTVTDGASVPKFFGFMSVIAGVLAIVFGVSLIRGGDDDDDDDDD